MIKELQNPPRFELVTDDVALKKICTLARQQAVVALDTEFVRVRTLYPKLGLIQLYAGEEVYLIDPLVIKDFSSFTELLSDQKVLKVLHACGEDLEVFHHYFQCQLPQPMMDTQVIARFLGFPQSTGLATLIQHYFKLEIDKGASRTDWLARPLSDLQLHYAAADVWYLLPLYQRMAQDLAKTEWQTAAEEDCRALLIKRAQINRNPDKAYLDIPNAWKLNRLELMRLQILAKWRMEEAIHRDLALNFVVRGEHLWTLAKENPKHTSQLLTLGLSVQEVRIHGKKLLQLLQQVKHIDPKLFPPLINRIADEPCYKSTFRALQQKLSEITPRFLEKDLIASRKGLDAMIKWYWRGGESLPDLLIGWRKPFGEQLLATLKALSSEQNDIFQP